MFQFVKKTQKNTPQTNKQNQLLYRFPDKHFSRGLETKINAFNTAAYGVTVFVVAVVVVVVVFFFF